VDPGLAGCYSRQATFSAKPPPPSNPYLTPNTTFDHNSHFLRRTIKCSHVSHIGQAASMSERFVGSSVRRFVGETAISACPQPGGNRPPCSLPRALSRDASKYNSLRIGFPALACPDLRLSQRSRRPLIVSANLRTPGEPTRRGCHARANASRDLATIVDQHNFVNSMRINSSTRAFG